MANALMIDPHTGQPIDWTQAQGPSTTVSGIDPKMLALYQQAGLWRPEYTAAAGDWGTDPASRAQARQQWMQSPEYQQLQNSLAGWTQGQARQDYNVADLLQSPTGQQFQSVSQNEGPSFHSDDYRNMATVLLGGLSGAYAAGDLAAAGTAAGGGSTAAMANGAVMGGATGAGVGGAGAAGYGGLAAGGALYADAGNGVVSDAGGGYSSEPSSFRPSQNYGEGMTGGETSAYDTAIKAGGNTGAKMAGTSGAGNTSLGDFFSGNGSTSDYMRAGQALYGMYSQNKATDAATAGNQAQLALQRQMWEANQAENKPLVDMRNSVLPQIQNLLQNPSSITSQPDYQFGLQQGANQINNRAAASGNYYSGAQQKAAQRYGQDYAGSKLDQSLNRLMGVATGTQVGSQNNQNANNQFAVSGGNALQQGGNIRAGGYIGQYNTVNNNLNDWMQDQTNRKYWGGGG